jgi:hypothetical protein
LVSPKGHTVVEVDGDNLAELFGLNSVIDWAIE